MNRPEHVPGLSLQSTRELLRDCRIALTNPTGLLDSAPITITGVSIDSRRVHPNDVYAALPGANVHGAAFAAQGVHAGAVAVLTDEAGLESIKRDGGITAPVLVVEDPRIAVATLAAAVYGTPSDDLSLVGITGTNGKTTTAYLLESAWAALGLTSGLIGTIETRIGADSVPSTHTTPESPDLQALLRLMVERGVGHCVMEVSSHALALHRVDALTFNHAVFTNLSQDHLDFHGTMEAYFEAKSRLFSPQRARRAVICIDDQWGARLADEAKIPVCTLLTPASPRWTSATDDADDAATGPQSAFGDQQVPTANSERTDWRLIPDEIAGGFTLVCADSQRATLHLTSALPGAHNDINTALAALVLLDSGLRPETIESAMSAHPRVPGRMERVELPDTQTHRAPLAVVDFAHTPDAIAATLAALRPLAVERGGPLVAVIGAGGDRDHGKRPLMGAAAAGQAHIVVVTDDNPRREDPALIRAAIARGARTSATTATIPAQITEIPGRAAAIAAALAAAGTGVVAVLGKGHETAQIIGAEVHPFDDRQALRQAWQEHTTSHPGQEGR